MEIVGRYLAYIYLLRVPLLVWALLLVLPFSAIPKGASLGPLLKGVFDIAGNDVQQAFLSFFLVTISSLLTAATIGVVARLIILDGEERFGAGHIPRGQETGADGIKLMLRLVPLSIVPPLVLGSCYATTMNVSAGVAAAFGIILGSLAFYFMMTWLHDQIWDKVVLRKIKPTFRMNLINLFLQFIASAVYVVWNVVQFLVLRLSPEGYIDPHKKELRPRHIFAVIQSILSVGFYVYLFVTKKYYSYLLEVRKYVPVLEYFDPWRTLPIIPTLCLFLVLVMLLCWALTAFTFFFDRFRIPVLASFMLVAGAVSHFPQGDHFYPSVPKRSSIVLSPAQVLSPRAGRPVVLVAASGGGIQSAAWTARVLSGLRKEFENQGEKQAEEFDRSIRLISSVSGGSVGAMYIVDAYQPDGRLPKVGVSLDDYPPVRAAEASSLDDVAWGLVYPDFLWSFAPFAKGFYLYPFYLVNGPNLVSDRGFTLEQAWQRTDSLANATLSQWRTEVAKGSKPAVVFNATIVETGERLLLSTTDFDSSGQRTDKTSPGWQDFSRMYPEKDIPVVTAARLSATFPFVTPAARIFRGDVFTDQYHVVDGGYYDNYGVATLIEWLDQAIKSSGSKPSRVLILQIRGSPAGLVDPPKGDYGWLFQLGHAFETLENVRGTGQFSRNEVELKLVQQLCKRLYDIDCTVIAFEYFSTDRHGDLIPGPLSWHLTPADIDYLRKEWNRHCPTSTTKTSVPRNCDKVLEFFRQ